MLPCCCHRPSICCIEDFCRRRKRRSFQLSCPVFQVLCSKRSPSLAIKYLSKKHSAFIIPSLFVIRDSVVFAFWSPLLLTSQALPLL